MDYVSEKITFNSTYQLVGNLFLPHKKARIGVLCLHGGGTGNKERYAAFQAYLATSGIASFAFDFTGCGESEGSFQEGSLKQRLYDAQQAYDVFQNYVEHIIIVGSSMGGHIAARLTETRNTSQLILIYPAAYANEAEHIVLNNSFTRILRTQNSWENSLSFNALIRYTGKVLVFYGEEDTVIPKGVQNKYKQLVGKKGKFVIVPNAPHSLFHVLMNPQSRQEILSFLRD